jgi:hypothetical protein
LRSGKAGNVALAGGIARSSLMVTLEDVNVCIRGTGQAICSDVQLLDKPTNW